MGLNEERVFTSITANQRVIRVAYDPMECVITSIPLEDVGADATRQVVCACPAVNDIIIEVDQIGRRTNHVPVDRVVVIVAKEPIATSVAYDGVVAGSAKDHVVPWSRRDCVAMVRSCFYNLWSCT